MSFSRRDFLKTSLVALGGSMPLFLSRTAAQAQPADRPGARDTILVVVQLTGGNDGLNTVIPYADADYARLRPTLRLQRDAVLTINDELALHPSLRGLKGLLDDNALAIVQGVGYPNPSQSHFRSMDIWQAASLNDTLTEGWIGKALRHLPAAASYHLAGNNEPAPLALNGAPVRVPSITSLDDFRLRTGAASATERTQQLAVIEGTATPRDGSPSLLDFVNRTATATYASSRRLAEIGRTYTPRVAYPPTQLGNHLRTAAQLIDAGIGARLFYVSIDGFDTHANQAPIHARLLTEVSEAMSAFFRDLSERGQRDRVMMMTFSEFGRRAGENGSQGTDHGSGAPIFLVGGRVRHGIIGAHPSLTRLEDGNLVHHTDFRRVYASLCENWLGVPSRQVVGEGFAPLDLIRV